MLKTIVIISLFAFTELILVRPPDNIGNKKIMPRQDSKRKMSASLSFVKNYSISSYNVVIASQLQWSLGQDE